MTIYIKDNEEYTLEQIQSAVPDGVDIDAYIEEEGFEIKEVDVKTEPDSLPEANFKQEIPVDETEVEEVIEEKEPEETPDIVTFNEFQSGIEPDETKVVKTEEDLEKENAKIDELLADLIPEISDEEKRNLPYSVQQRVIKQYGGKFTRGNVDVELERFEQLKADPFKNLREGFEGDKKAFNEFAEYFQNGYQGLENFKKGF